MKLPMNESEWLTCFDPSPMFFCIENVASQRKLRLLAVACCRRVWECLPEEPSRKALAVLERYADGEATDYELIQADAANQGLHDELEPRYSAMGAVSSAVFVPEDGLEVGIALQLAQAASNWVISAEEWATPDAMLSAYNETAGVKERIFQAHFIRDNTGNPFRNVILTPHGSRPSSRRWPSKCMNPAILTPCRSW